MKIAQKTETAAKSRDWKRAVLLTTGALGISCSVFVGQNARAKELDQMYPLDSAAGTLFGIGIGLENHWVSCHDADLSAQFNHARIYLHDENPVIRSLVRVPEFGEASFQLDYLSTHRMLPSVDCGAFGSELRMLGRWMLFLSTVHEADLEGPRNEIRADFAPIFYSSAAGIALSAAAIVVGLRRKNGKTEESE